jgi:transcriptional regulator with XRE-family HTH domain
MPGKRGPQPIERHVGRRIRMRRRMLGISQMRLGTAIGVTFQQIQKYEYGTNRVGAGRLQQIANALECNPGWFFEDRRGSPRGKQAAARYPNPALSAFLADAHGSAIVRRFVRLPPRIKRAIAALTAAVAECLEQD